MAPGETQPAGTMESSNGGDSAAPPTLEAATNSEEHKKRIPLIWIPATLSLGLLIAAIYLGGRIVSAHPHGTPAAALHVAKTAAPAPAPVAPAPVTPSIPAVSQTLPQVKESSPAPEPVSSAQVTPITPNDEIPIITPKAGERYIQVGALDLEMTATRRFVDRLRNEKLEPHVAPGPKPELMRVLIGPFDNPDALSARQAQLQAEGIDTFVRQY
jgi:cell division septation protein DedD